MMKMPKAITRFGLPGGPDQKVGIVAAALPKMRMPSGLKAEMKMPPKMKLTALAKVAGQKKKDGGSYAGPGGAVGAGLGVGAQAFVQRPTAVRRRLWGHRSTIRDAQVALGKPEASKTLRRAMKSTKRLGLVAAGMLAAGGGAIAGSMVKKEAAEISATREQTSGDLEGGAPLGVAFKAMVRSDVATESTQVADDQASFIEEHGSAAGWEGGRP
jgi:hypothetical protein